MKVCLLFALDYLAFEPGREAEAVSVAYTSLLFLRTASQIAGSKLPITAFYLTSGPPLLLDTGQTVPTLGFDSECSLASWDP